MRACWDASEGEEMRLMRNRSLRHLSAVHQDQSDAVDVPLPAEWSHRREELLIVEAGSAPRRHKLLEIPALQLIKAVKYCDCCVLLQWQLALRTARPKDEPLRQR